MKKELKTLEVGEQFILNGNIYTVYDKSMEADYDVIYIKDKNEHIRMFVNMEVEVYEEDKDIETISTAIQMLLTMREIIGRDTIGINEEIKELVTLYNKLRKD